MTATDPVVQLPPAGPPAPIPASARRASLPAAVVAVAAGQLARARVARVPLLFVATLQSAGILVLLRGVVRRGDATTGASAVAGATVLVVGFVALNLLAQRLGALRAARALDYYLALPAPPVAVVLGTAAAYGAFTLPGAVVVAVAGAAAYGLPLAHVWLAVPVIAVSVVALAGLGAVLGLLLPRPELATIAGQLGMTGVLFLGIVAPAHLPVALRAIRDAVPAMPAVDVLADALGGRLSAGRAALDLGLTLAYGVVLLALASAALRRAVDR